MELEEDMKLLILEFELKAKILIRKKLENLPDDAKGLLRIIPFEAEIPSDPHHIDVYIQSFAGEVAGRMEWNEFCRQQSLKKLRLLGIESLQEGTNAEKVAELDAILRTRTHEELRVAGVFLEGNTKEEAEEALNTIVNEDYKRLVQYLAEEKKGK